MIDIEWTNTELVLDHMGSPALQVEDLRFVDLCVRAANRAVAYWRPDLDPPAPGEPKNPMIVLGSTMLATAWFQRRNGDVSTFTEFGGPPPALSRDIERLLGINRSAKPVIA